MPVRAAYNARKAIPVPSLADGVTLAIRAGRPLQVILPSGERWNCLPSAAAHELRR